MQLRALFPDRKITGVFQPHLYSRTKDFAEGFAKALDQLDEIISDGYLPGHENLPIEGVTSRIIYEQMENPNKQLADKVQCDEIR